jgi:hypothetical protein
MADSAPDARQDTQKRRSARILQAVPLTVTGVDALGRPFQERTSTVVINCHGCRYQSKHYVLKNMWVKFEVPHPEPGREPRSVRARVMWIQRPRTVRELFQIGAELEVPGNLWGIAFPQHDWFPFPEGDAAEVGRSAEQPPEESRNDWLSGEASPATNVRVLPLAGSSEPSAALAQHMAQLVSDATKQVREVARASVAEAAVVGSDSLLGSMQDQLKEAAERSVQSFADAAARQAIEHAMSKAASDAEERLHKIQQRWNEELLAAIEQARGTLLGRLGEVEQERRAAFGQQLEILLQQARIQIEAAARDSETLLAQSRESRVLSQQQSGAAPALREIEQEIRNCSAEARALVAELDDGLKRWNERLEALTSEAQTAWHARLHADLTAATELWEQRIESSLDSAAQKAAERLARNSQAASDRIESELGSRLSSFGRVFAEAAADAERKLAALQASLDGETARARQSLSEVQAASSAIEEFTAELNELKAGVRGEVERSAAALLDAQSREMDRRAQIAMVAWTERLQPSLEAAGREVAARLGAKLDQDLVARMQKADQLCARLQTAWMEGDHALRRQQETLGKVSDQAAADVRDRLQETIDRMSSEFMDSGRAASEKWLGEIETRASETAHATFESLFKTAEWYEKKVHQQMQNALEKGTELAGTSLREKAGEISGLLAAELDHYSRSYVQHARGQFDEAVKEALEGAQQHVSDLIAASVGSLAGDVQRQADIALADTRARTQAALGQVAAQTVEQLTKFRTEIDQEGQRLSAEFRAALAQESQQARAAAEEELSSLITAALEDLRGQNRALRAQFTETQTEMKERAIEDYRKRLETASSSWLLTTVSRLDQQSQQQVQAIAQAAEQRVREACVQALADVTENLKRKAAEVPILSAVPEKGAAASQ